MKKLAFAALLCGAFGLVACGGDDGDDNGGPGVDFADAGETPDSGGDPSACNPVTQTGCEAGEKCAQLVESEEPFLARTACVPDGDVEAGGECMRGEAGPMGYDNCAAGLACNGVCVAICNVPQQMGCSADESCVLYTDTFDDVGDGSTVGLCAPACDPTTQTLLEGGEGGTTECPNGGGCYLNTNLGTTSCARVPEAAVGLGMDDSCYGPTEENCFLNGCDKGYMPFWNDPTGTSASALCAAFCSHVDTFVEGGTAQGNPIGAADGTQCAGTVVAGGQGEGADPYSCRSIQWFADAVRTGWGICASNQIELGSCTAFDKDAYVTGLTESETYCLDNPEDPMTFNVERCPQGCISAETLDEWFADPSMLQRAKRDLIPVKTDKGLLVGGGMLIEMPAN